MLTKKLLKVKIHKFYYFIHCKKSLFYTQIDIVNNFYTNVYSMVKKILLWKNTVACEKSQSYYLYHLSCTV